MELKSGDLFFLLEIFVGSKKIREVEKLLSRKNNTQKHNYCMIPLLIKSQ